MGVESVERVLSSFPSPVEASTDFQMIAQWFLFEKKEEKYRSPAPTAERPPPLPDATMRQFTASPSRLQPAEHTPPALAHPPLARLLFDDFLPKSFLFPLLSFHSWLSGDDGRTDGCVAGCSILHRAAMVQCLIVAAAAAAPP